MRKGKADIVLKNKELQEQVERLKVIKNDLLGQIVLYKQKQKSLDALWKLKQAVESSVLQKKTDSEIVRGGIKLLLKDFNREHAFGKDD